MICALVQTVPYSLLKDRPTFAMNINTAMIIKGEKL